eukprot:Skav233333  [mRNA]  locus=scaffold2479:101377:102874:- [translate_table: standard]
MEITSQTSNQFDLPVADSMGSMWQPWQLDLASGQDPDSVTGHVGAESEPQDHFSNDADLDPDQGLAADISAQVALFLAGGDCEDSDEDVQDEIALPEPAPGEGANSEAALSVASMTIDAPPFVPKALQKSDAPEPASTISRKELRLGDLLPSDPNPSPAPTPSDAFLAMLQLSPLPVDLEDQRNFKKFEAAIAKAVLNFYRKQLPPTVTMLQKELRENHQIPEDWLIAILQVCARDTAKLYLIGAPVPGEEPEPTILLTRPPLWFQGFPKRSQDGFKEHQQGAKGGGKGNMQVISSEGFGQREASRVPISEGSEKETKRKLRNASLGGAKKSDKHQALAVGPVDSSQPLVPGVVTQTQARYKDVDSVYSADVQENETLEGKVDVSSLLQELILAFPDGMSFSSLKDHLRTNNEGSFGETAFKCSKLASWKIAGNSVLKGAEAKPRP